MARLKSDGAVLAKDAKAVLGGTSLVLKVLHHQYGALAYKVPISEAGRVYLDREFSMLNDLWFSGLEVFPKPFKLLNSLNGNGLEEIDGYAKLIGKPCLVMEYIEGDNLGTLLEGSRLRDVNAAALAYALLRSVAAVHSRDYVIGDVNPNNIFVENHRIRFVDCAFVSHEKDSLRIPFTNGVEPAEVRDGIISKSSDVYMIGQIVAISIYGQRAKVSGLPSSPFGKWLSKCIGESKDERFYDAIDAFRGLQRLGARKSL